MFVWMYVTSPLHQVYLAEDAKREMGLQREDLVALAYFLGSDYTEGVNGVGIVNAVEIINAFSMRVDTGGPLKGLKSFKDWLTGYDFGTDVFASPNKEKAKLGKLKSSELESTEESDERSALLENNLVSA